MNIASVIFALGAVSMLAATGCAANVEGDPAGTSSAAIMSGGGGNSGPGPQHPFNNVQVIDCGTMGTLSTGPSPWNQNEGNFMWAMYLDGCGVFSKSGQFEPNEFQFAFGANGDAAAVTFCPAANVTASYIEYWSKVDPVYSGEKTSGGTTCSNGELQIPGGWIEVEFDPNCDGTACGSVTIEHELL